MKGEGTTFGTFVVVVGGTTDKQKDHTRSNIQTLKVERIFFFLVFFTLLKIR